MKTAMFHKILTVTKVYALSRLFREKKGFSLVEISIVLVIIGLILGAGVTIWRSSIGSARLSATKTNLANIKNSVINFSIANGRLPCPDTTAAPPNNIGVSNPPGSGTCAYGAGCPTPPCYVPYVTLQLQLPGGTDSFGSVFRYDVSFEPAAGAGMTNTTQDTFCGVLFEYLNHAPDTGVPRQPCVTDANDPTPANGQINPPGQGYGVAAVIISQTSVDNVFNAPPGLSGKNVVGADREYEMATRQNGTAYGDLVAELTYGDLYNKICNSQNTRLSVFAPIAGNFSVRIPSGGSCYSITTTIAAFLTLGQTLDYYAGCSNCTANPLTCDSGGPTTSNISFLTLSNIDWNGNRNGQVNANQTDH